MTIRRTRAPKQRRPTLVRRRTARPPGMTRGSASGRPTRAAGDRPGCLGRLRRSLRSRPIRRHRRPWPTLCRRDLSRHLTPTGSRKPRRHHRRHTLSRRRFPSSPQPSSSRRHRSVRRQHRSPRSPRARMIRSEAVASETTGSEAGSRRAGATARGAGVTTGRGPRSPRARGTCRRRTAGGGQHTRRHRRRSCRRPGTRSRPIRYLTTTRRRRLPPRGEARTTAGDRRKAERTGPGSSRSPFRAPHRVRVRSQAPRYDRTWHGPAR